jgi:hypothetical protein
MCSDFDLYGSDITPTLQKALMKVIAFLKINHKNNVNIPQNIELKCSFYFKHILIS